MAKSNTNSKMSSFVDKTVDKAVAKSMKDVNRLAKLQSYKIQNSVTQFFDLFAAMAINTPAAPQLGAYTPSYATLSSAYARRKPTGTGFFYNTGDLQRVVEALSSKTTNLLGKSSYYLDMTNSGTRKGYTTTKALVPRSVKTGRFVSRSEGFKDFTVRVVHQPFSKVDNNFEPKKLERDIFKSGYDEIYAKLTNKQRKGIHNPYRPAFYTFMKWWLNVHLKEVLK